MCHSFIDYIINEIIRKNSNCIIFIGGKSGRGKSYATMKIGELVSEKLIEMKFRDKSTFGIENIMWDIKSLIKVVRTEKLANEEQIFKGTVLGIEETGVIANSRAWYSATNKALHYLSQTYRRNNYCTIFNAPDLSFVDVGVRKTIHIYLEAWRIVRGEYSEFRILVPQSNKFGQLDFRPFKVFDELDGVIKNVHFIRFELPKNVKMLDEYEKRKKAFNDALYKKLSIHVDKIEMEEEKELMEGLPDDYN